MEEFIKCDLEFEDGRIQTLISTLRECFDNRQNNFSKICETIYNIWSYCKGNYWKAKDNEYYNSYTLLEKFGFNKKSVSRYKLCYERFIHHPSCSLHAIYENFTPSKLYELLVLSEDTAKHLIVIGLILPTMTVKQIREVVKTVTGKDKDFNEVVEDTSLKEDEEEPEEEPFFNPNNHYERDFFENCSMEQLISICLSYQFEYEKLKKK